MTDLFILTPLDGLLDVRFPKLAAQSHPSSVSTQSESWQETFFGHNEIGQIVRLTYSDANPSEDVIIKFDPTKRSKIPTVATAKKIGRISWLFFLGLLLILWFPSLWLFVNLTTNFSSSAKSFLWEAPTVGFLWGVSNGFLGLIVWVSSKGSPLSIYDFRRWGEVEQVLLIPF